MSPIDWAIRPLKKYATFSGRAPRAELWWFFLAAFIVYMIMWFVFVAVVGVGAAQATEPSAGMLGAFGAAGMFMLIFWLALLIPTLAVQVRRLHDTNRTGWWLLVFYLLYGVYMVLLMGAVFGAAASGGGEPSAATMGSFAGIGILAFVLMIYGIMLIVFYCLPGTKGPNKYGDDPYGANVGEVFA